MVDTLQGQLLIFQQTASGIILDGGGVDDLGSQRGLGESVDGLVDGPRGALAQEMAPEDAVRTHLGGGVFRRKYHLHFLILISNWNYYPINSQTPTDKMGMRNKWDFMAGEKECLGVGQACYT